MRYFFTLVWPCIVTDSLWIKPTDALHSSFIDITTLHVSGSLSAHHQEFLAIYRLWYIICSCDDRFLPGVGWKCWQSHPTPGSKRSQLHKMYQNRWMSKNSWWWAERLPETCRVIIPIKLELSAPLGFIHKESLWDNVGKYAEPGQTTIDNTMPHKTDAICMQRT